MTEESWKTRDAAEKYMKTVDVVAPGRKEIRSVISGMATASGPAMIKCNFISFYRC